VQDALGNTPLAIAVLQGKIETATVLLDYGADPNVPNAKGVRFFVTIHPFFTQL
jgi:ankyrin repeat protein